MKTPICPICSSLENNLLFSLSSHEVATYLFPDKPKNADEIRPIIERIFGEQHVNFLICKNCSFGFADPFKAGTPEFYSTLYYSDFNYPTQKWEYSKTLQVLRVSSNNRPEYKLLEIGAGNGSFLSYLVEQDILKKENIYSTEFSESAVSTILSKGFNCTNKNIVQLKEEGKLPQFNTICLFQVLEHLGDIDAVFQSINALSTPDTDLFFSVPNSKLRSFLDKQGVFYDIPPVHIGKYSFKSFQFLGRKYKWEVISCAYEPMSIKSKFRKFLFERYWNNHYAINFERSRNVFYKRFLRYTLMSWIILRYIFVFFRLIRSDAGTSFWIHLKKAK